MSYSKLWIITILAVISLLLTSQAQVSAMAEVQEIVICTAVEDRAPVGEDTLFLSTVERLYCFTKVSGAGGSSTISHVWYFGDQEMARVDLKVEGENWRTWSSKRIVEDWKGDWRVDVLSESGEILMSTGFKIQ